MIQYDYRAFGLDIRCNLPLPEIPTAAQCSANPDLVIDVATKTAPQRMSDTSEVVLRDDWAILPIPTVGEFWVSNGRCIQGFLDPQADIHLAKVFLLGSAIGLVLHQRGLLVMHASAVLIDGRATLFVGDSGAGKSTIAASLARDGYDVLADDVMPIAYDSDKRAVVWPGACAFKLWGDTVDSLGLQRERLVPISNRDNKFYVLNPRTVADEAYPIARIIELARVTEEQPSVSLDALGPLEALRVVSTNTYRTNYIDLLGRRHEHFRQCGQLIHQVPVLQLRRPWDLQGIRASLQGVL